MSAINDLLQQIETAGIEVEKTGRGTWEFYKGTEHCATIWRTSTDGKAQYHYEDFHEMSNPGITTHNWTPTDHFREFIKTWTK